MSRKNNRINWDVEAKKRRDQERADREALQDRQKALWVLTEEYKKLKRRLLKKNAGRTKEDVYNFILDLRNQVTARLSKEGLESHKDFALSMLDEKMGIAKGTGINEKNCITAYQPDRPLDAPGKEFHKSAMLSYFATLEELTEVPFVRAVMYKEGFICLLVKWPYLCAFFNDEELVKIGILTNSIGLGNEQGGLPTWDEFRAEWIAEKAPARDKKDN